MQELVYKRGEGWIYPDILRSPIFDMQGQQACFEFRLPKPGEFFDGAPHDTYFFKNGTPDWRSWINNYEGRSVSSLHLKCNDLPHAEYLEQDTYDLYVTLVFV